MIGMIEKSRFWLEQKTDLKCAIFKPKKGKEFI
jgi:hypothetical protein